jgi:hypothetical protein
LNKVLDLDGFIDVDCNGDMDHKISTSDYVFKQFGEIIWMSKR